MYLVIIIIINFEEDIKRSFQELRLDFNSPELELELECLELELELKLIVSSGIGIGIENNGIGIGIELKKRNWHQPWRSHVGPHFFAHRFREFCRRGTQERDIFSEIAVTPCIQFAGDNFSRNLLTAIAFVPVRWRQFFTKSTPAYLSMRAGTHAVRWAATLGGALTPPLCRRVGSS